MVISTQLLKDIHEPIVSNTSMRSSYAFSMTLYNIDKVYTMLVMTELVRDISTVYLWVSVFYSTLRPYRRAR